MKHIGKWLAQTKHNVRVSHLQGFWGGEQKEGAQQVWPSPYPCTDLYHLALICLTQCPGHCIPFCEKILWLKKPRYRQRPALERGVPLCLGG